MTGLNIVASWHELISSGQAHAQAARFDACLAQCQRIVDLHGDSADAMLSVGGLLVSIGFLSVAHQCFLRVCQLAPDDLRAVVNLANVAQQAGDHAQCRRLYADLSARRPDHPVIRRNTLVSLEYDPEVPDSERFAHALAWGEWAMAKAGGPQPTLACNALEGRPLRVGYVSADVCQHTVGLFVTDALRAHRRARVEPFVYSAGAVRDWVTEEIRGFCNFRDVAKLGDSALAQQIRQDGIDVLVDLSGHTGGSRLTAFSYRPAPVMVSWLGYFATTGLQCLDGVLLDQWHAPEGTDAQFIEPVIRLPRGRFCYQPVPWAPAEVAPLPCLTRGNVTFGSFNNTAKLNDGVFDLWARVLAGVPRSRIVLKWRTFNDEALRTKVTDAFARRGIAPERIELRGPSFHADVLKEYADIDIALDPFPFTGGLTSCEALWMGVPVVTWPQSRVVSRQTFALLSAIGLPELAAQDAGDYVSIARGLANDPERLNALRGSLRSRMRASALMDVAGFTRALEDCLIDLYQSIRTRDEKK